MIELDWSVNTKDKIENFSGKSSIINWKSYPLTFWHLKHHFDETDVRYKPGAIAKPSNQPVSTQSTNNDKKRKCAVNKLTKQNVSSTKDY